MMSRARSSSSIFGLFASSTDSSPLSFLALSISNLASRILADSPLLLRADPGRLAVLADSDDAIAREEEAYDSGEKSS